MKCRSCGTELKQGAKFCSQCGERVRRYCTECGREIPSLEKVCFYCSTKISENESEKETKSKALESTVIQEGIVSEHQVNFAKGNVIEHQETDSFYGNLTELQDNNILNIDASKQMNTDTPVAEGTKENFSEEFQPSGTKRKGKKGIFIGSVVLLTAGIIFFFVWIGSGVELSDYIPLSKDDVAKFISKQGLTDENDIGVYSKEGLMMFLTENGNIDMLSIESPEYKLYGIKVGDEFTVLGDSRKLSSHSFGFLNEIEVEAGKILYYGALSINKDKPGYGQMIQIHTDKDDKVTEIFYSKSDANEIAEALNELGDEGLDDSYESEYIEEDDNSTETKNRQETSSRQSENDKKAMDLAKQYEGEWWDLNSQRCYMDVEATGGNKVSIVVSWSNGYADDAKWEMTGQVNGRNGRIVYKDCTQYDIHYDEYGGEQKTVNYTNGSGYFYSGNDGYLYWEDEVEGAGAGCYFEKDESIGTQETTGYTMDVPLGNATRMYVVQCKASITLRSAPSTDAAEITQIPLYAAVDYYGTLDNGFAQVAYNGQLGYVLGSYLDYYEPQVYTGIKCQIVNCKQSVTLRTSITAQDKEICQIPLGTIIDYIEEGTNGYCLVNYNGIMGYVKYEYLLFL